MTRVSEDRLERKEFKYLVPRHVVPLVRETLRTVCRPDRYAGPDGTYRIRSLYLDTHDYELFWANAHESPDRYKARIRCYPDSQSPVFFEIKRRVLDTIVKTRAAVPVDRWQTLAATTGSDAEDAHGSRAQHNTRTHERFLSLLHARHLRPVLIVEYVREAYMSEIDLYARATFDTRVACQVQDRFDLDVEPRRWHFISPPSRTVMEPEYVLLELKFGASAPPWMVALVRRFDLIRCSFSKYGYGLRAELTLPAPRVSAVD